MDLTRPHDVLPGSARRWLRRTVSFATGVACERFGPETLVVVLPAAAVMAAVLGAAGSGTGDGGTAPRMGDAGGRRLRWGRRLGMTAGALAWVLAGLLAARAHALADPVPPLLRRWEARGFVSWVTPVELRGRVIDTAALPDRRAALTLRPTAIRLPGHASWRGIEGAVSVRLSVAVPGAPGAAPGDALPWRAGDLLELSARLGPPRSFRNPGAFDIASYHKTRGIDLLGSVKSPLLIARTGRARRGPADVLAGVRRTVVTRLGRAAGEDRRDTAAFLAALLLGEREEIDPSLRDALQRAGVYHIVALSGLNVALAMLVLEGLLRLCVRRPAHRRLLLAAGVLLYWALARGGGSMSRASLMGLLHLAGALLGRPLPPGAAIGISGVAMLATRPIGIGDAGLQLSFIATLALILTLRRGGPAVRPAPLGWLFGSLRTSAAALLWTAPLSAHHFQMIAPGALIANLVAVPIASVLLVASAAIALAPAALNEAAGALVTLCDALIAALGRACAVVAPWWLTLYVVPPGGVLVVATLAGVGAATLCRGTVRVASALVTCGAFVMILAAGRGPAPAGRLEVIALDVGQGDAVLVRFPSGTSMLVDAGGLPRDRFDVGARVVAPALRALGLLRLDILAVTHAHRDHIGGAAAILSQFRPAALWLGKMPAGDRSIAALERVAVERGAIIVYPRRGARLVVGGVHVQCLNPQGGDASLVVSNDDSLVLMLRRDRRSVLLSGDIEAAVEGDLARDGFDLRSDLLKVAHHGSGGSSTAAFLARVRPALAVISAGASNPWGHPAREVLDRLRAAGAETFVTAADGAVRFVTDGRQDWAVTRFGAPVDPSRPPGIDRVPAPR